MINLLYFVKVKYFRLVGSSVIDFKVSPIASDIGCIQGDTVQEVGGDIVFLAKDGIRTISGTEKVGDFNLLSVSKVIQDKIDDFVTAHQNFSSVTIGSKHSTGCLVFLRVLLGVLLKGLLEHSF